jgi:hypothetical protein
VAAFKPVTVTQPVIYTETGFFQSPLLRDEKDNGLLEWFVIGLRSSGEVGRSDSGAASSVRDMHNRLTMGLKETTITPR